MSYVVTARKWRPQLFRDVIGQAHVTETLQSAIRSGRIGHAYLFSGPRGVGKTTVARIFAKALNCEHGPAEEPCNECPVCTAIQSGSSMDIQELDGASNNSVDDVRELISRIGYHSTECRYKMYIVDEVHMLSNAAFNALLKTLEEPPANVVFVFATTEPRKIPATILSRCQRYDFHRLSVSDIAGKLAAIAGADGIEADEGALMLIARRATGAMRDAESIFEQLKSSRKDRVTVDDVTDVLGVADREVFFDIAARCHDGDVGGAIALFNAFYDAGGDLREFVEGLLEHLRDMLYASFDGGLGHAVLSGEMKERLTEQAAWFGKSDIIRMIGFVTEVETSLSYAVLPVLRIEVALARMATMESTVQLRELFDLVGGSRDDTLAPSVTQTSPSRQAAPPPPVVAPPIRREPEPPPTPARDDREPPVESYTDDDGDGYGDMPVDDDMPDRRAASIPPDIDGITANWHRIVAAVSDAYPSVGPSLEKGEPVSFDNGQLMLHFGHGENFHLKAIETNMDRVAGIVGALTGQSLTLGFAREKAPDSKKKTNELDDLIAREPVIGEIMDLFGGEIK